MVKGHGMGSKNQLYVIILKGKFEKDCRSIFADTAAYMISSELITGIIYFLLIIFLSHEIDKHTLTKVRMNDCLNNPLHHLYINTVYYSFPFVSEHYIKIFKIIDIINIVLLFYKLEL